MKQLQIKKPVKKTAPQNLDLRTPSGKTLPY